LNLAVTNFYDELVARCKQGDRQGYTALYAKYAQPMYNTSLRIVNNRNDAEDVLQDAFTAAFRNIGEFEYTSTFGAWLKRIVINRSIDLLRKRKALVVDIEEADRYADPVAGEETDDTSHWRVEQVKKCIRELPTGYRTVISLHLLEGYSYEEIAESMGVHAVTVRTQYHRARKKLVDRIRKEVSNEG
jgi:RNA polymerase sigma-70 factor (ECF subfamily)